MRKSPELGPPPLPYISVIVPVRNEAAFIRKTLQQLLNQNYDTDRYEILVADGQSTDDTTAIVRALTERHANLRLLPNQRRWSSAGRNAALEKARGEIVVVVDGHCEVSDPSYLWNVVDAFERSGADCLGRPQPLEVSDATVLQRGVALARSSCLGHHPESLIYSTTERFVRPQSVAVAYRRSVFDYVGAFDENFDACEDVEFNHRIDRAGMRCFFTPRIAVHYYPRSTISGLFLQMARYGRGRIRLMRKHPETFGIVGFVPAILVLAVVVGPWLSVVSALLTTIWGIGFGIYIILIGMMSVLLAVKGRDVRLLPLMPLIFLAIHCGAGMGIWHELATGPGRVPNIKSPLIRNSRRIRKTRKITF